MEPLGVCLKFLTFIGLNPEIHEKNKKYWIVKWIYLSIMAYNLIPQTTFMITNIQDVDKVAQALPVYCEIFIMNLKLLSYNFGVKNLHYILLTIKTYSKKRIAHNEIKHLLVAEQKSKLIFKIYGIIVLSSLSFVAFIPAGLQFALFLMGKATEETFADPFNNVYLYDNSRRYIYQLSYTFTTITTSFVSYSLVSIDCLFCTVVLYMLAIVEDLQDYVKELDQTFQEEEGPLKIQYHFKTVVDFHNALLEFIKRFTASTSSAFSLQYLGSIIIMCACIYQSLMIDDVTSLAKAFSYCCSGMSQLLMYCWYGNMITEKFREISETIYSLSTYNYPMNIKKYIPIVIMRSQKPVILKGWGLLEGNLEGFMNVLNASMSALAVLRSMN